jgi:hypothetical protein
MLHSKIGLVFPEGAQRAQTHFPHRRQWCRRTNGVNTEEHSMHCAESGCQSTPDFEIFPASLADTDDDASACHLPTSKGSTDRFPTRASSISL